MNEFIIVTDSCADLPIDYVRENNIPFASMTCRIKGEEFIDDFGVTYTSKEFYKDMRNGNIPKTSQPSSDNFYNIFRPIVEKGMDILYVAVSTGLSGTLNSANVAKNMIKEEFPNCKIKIVDILTASLGQGIMVMKSIEMKKEGKTLDEIVNFLEEIKQKLNTYIIVDDLIHLKRGGRISSAVAMVGALLNIKPMITISNLGKVLTIDKVRGRKKAINQLIEKILERIEPEKNDRIAISHGDCLEEANVIKEALSKKLNINNFIINYNGPVVGSYGGPGSLAVFFIGKEREKGEELI